MPELNFKRPRDRRGGGPTDAALSLLYRGHEAHNERAEDGIERGVEMLGDVPGKTKLPFTFIALFPVVTLPVLLGGGP